MIAHSLPTRRSVPARMRFTKDEAANPATIGTIGSKPSANCALLAKSNAPGQTYPASRGVKQEAVDKKT
jgi:hypothetical protein